VDVELELITGPGMPSKLGNLPIVHVQSDSSHLEGGVALYRFNAFLDAPRLAREFESILKHPDTTGGLIIDVRGNIGGLMLLTMGMGGWFIEDPVSLGIMEMKGTPMKIRLNPRKPRFDLPVAILTDECSISAAEVFAGGMQDLGLAKVFGSRSAGLVLPSTVARLPSGDGFQYAMAGYQSASGRTLELDGVVPDEGIELTRKMFQDGSDPVLEAAAEWIRQQEK
jgi:carboxyl-terminal processing protease